MKIAEYCGEGVLKIIDIILCDDDKFILKLGSEKIKEEIDKNRLEARVVCMATDSSYAFNYLNNNKGAYLIFLDLDFGNGNLNGIDIAKNIKLICDNVKIVFLTNHHEMAMQVLSSGVEPFGFLEKTTDMNKLSDGYKRYIQMAISALNIEENDDDIIRLTLGIDETVSIKKSEISYIESVKTISHGISYHTINGSCITVRDSMDNIQQSLGEEFLRVHRSIIANRKYIVRLSGTTIYLSNGEEIPCSVRMRSKVKKWLN